MVLARVPAAPAHAEEPAGDFLPRANFGKGAVEAFVQIDLNGFFVGSDRRGVELFHTFLGWLKRRVEGAWQIVARTASTIM